MARWSRCPRRSTWPARPPAGTAAGRLERRLARATDSLEGVETDRAQLMVALARAFDADPEAFADAAPLVTAPAPRTRRLVERAYRAPAEGDLAMFADLLTEDAGLGVYDGRSPAMRWEYDGFERVVAGMSSLWPLNPRIRGPMVQSGDLVWFRYVETDTSGVNVIRVQGDRIARMWIVMLGPGDGRR